MRAIALTGRIGSGKSTIAAMLRDRGAATVDADAIVHDLYRKDADLRRALAARFGDGILTPDGVDRVALGGFVFSDDGARRDLEALVHPRVHDREAAFLDDCRRRGRWLAAIEAVKVVESGGADRCDELWIAWCDDEAAIGRLEGRGMGRGDARRRLATQGTIATWVERFTADSARMGRRRPVVMIDNGGPPEQLEAQLDALLGARQA